MTFCESNPLHAPPVGTFKTASNGDALEILMCADCMRARVGDALDNREQFVVTTTTPGALMAAVVEPRAPARDPQCVERWPACGTGLYDPRCCRFPKSCSADW